VFYFVVLFQLEPSAFASQPFSPKEKHNVNSSASMTTTARLGTLVSVLRRFEYLAERSNVLDHYNDKENISIITNF
jgi:hypothetical protein